MMNNVSAQSIDSRISGTTSGPDSIAAIYSGEYIVDFTTVGMSTECHITPTDSNTTRKVIIGVECLPDWIKDGSGQPLLPKFPIDANPIKLVYSAPLGDIVAAAKGGWEDVLSRWGLSGLNFQLVPNGSCSLSDDHCIMIGDGLLSCDAGACGCSVYGGITNGVYDKRSIISIKPNMSDVNHKVWVVGHELGHLLGLKDAPGCTGQTSVMKTSACDTAPGTGEGRATDNDGLPVVKTVYGNGPTKTCGW